MHALISASVKRVRGVQALMLPSERQVSITDWRMGVDQPGGKIVC